MHKLYLRNFNGQDSRAWETNWQDEDMNESLIYAAYNNPYKVDFDRFCLPGKNIIEGGCGLGRFVVYYAKKGCNIVGIDFAKQTVEYLKANVKGLPVQYASVENIPYENNAFDIYLSIGVMEHFEEGPDSVLTEAYRILKPDGYLILTVPYINLCKKVKYRIDLLKYRVSKKTNLMKFDDNCYYKKVTGFMKEMNRDFHQYEFTRREAAQFISKNRFKVVYMHGCSIAHGLYHIPVIGRSLYYFMKHFMRGSRKGAGLEKREEAKQMPFDSIKIPPYRKNNFIYELIKDVVIRENTDRLRVCPLIRFLQEFCGDFLLIVCKPSIIYK